MIASYAIKRSEAEVRHYVPSDLCPSFSAHLDPFRLQEGVPKPRRLRRVVRDEQILARATMIGLVGA